MESIFCSYRISKARNIDMISTRDNWERLVRTVLDREKWKQLAMCDSLSSTWTSFDYGSSSRIIYDDNFSCNVNQTGKKEISIGARKLGIAWGEDPRYWRWKSHPDSRFSEVAHLAHVFWLDIEGKIGTHILSQKTRYGAYLVFKLDENNRGLESVTGVVRIVKFEKEVVNRRANLMKAAKMREDGWMEVELGLFSNDEAEDGEVEARVMNTSDYIGKFGIIVQAIEFRPSEHDDSKHGFVNFEKLIYKFWKV